VAEKRTDLFDGEPKRILHIAPEEAIERLVRQLPRVTYLSADIENPRASVRMDITNIEYPDSSFDVILCNHVLEHVPDDRKALREFHRVLSPGGLGMIQVPVSDPVTFEDFTITDPEERLRIFGQHDHVRRYGPDIRERMEEARFAVEEITTEDVTSEGEALRMGLMKGDQVFVCRKRMSSAS
jgi:ubiquinone/menaquinone biosynthesis C-methylase UbiE